MSFPLLHYFLHVGRGGGAGDDLDQFSGDDGLTGTIVQNLEAADHVSGIF